MTGPCFGGPKVERHAALVGVDRLRRRALLALRASAEPLPRIASPSGGSTFTTFGAHACKDASALWDSEILGELHDVDVG